MNLRAAALCSSFALAGLSAGCSSAAVTYAAKCEAACTVPSSGPCATGQDAAACKANCVAMTDGLSVSCAQCIVEKSAWTGVLCQNNTLCDFGAWGVDCGASNGSTTCTAQQERCDGFRLAKTTDSGCELACAPGADAG